MAPHTQPHVGDAIRLTRSGHSAGCGERGTIVAVLGKPGTEVLRVKWFEHLETFVPLHVAELDQDESSGSSS